MTPDRLAEIEEEASWKNGDAEVYIPELAAALREAWAEWASARVVALGAKRARKAMKEVEGDLSERADEMHPDIGQGPVYRCWAAKLKAGRGE